MNFRNFVTFRRVIGDVMLCFAFGNNNIVLTCHIYTQTHTHTHTHIHTHTHAGFNFAIFWKDREVGEI